jgi:monothiol glutaredoxin
VNGELVGGCDIITEMHAKGELKALLDEAAPKE